MDISEVAKKSGLAASALRYYERKGLIHALESDGARRKFSPAVLDQLALIALGQAAGFSLDEIRVMFTPGGAPEIDRAMLSAKADELDRMVKRLKAMIEGLRHAAGDGDDLLRALARVGIHGIRQDVLRRKFARESPLRRHVPEEVGIPGLERLKGLVAGEVVHRLGIAFAHLARGAHAAIYRMLHKGQRKTGESTQQSPKRQRKRRLRPALRQRPRCCRNDPCVCDGERLALNGFSKRLQIAFIDAPVCGSSRFQFLKARFRACCRRFG